MNKCKNELFMSTVGVNRINKNTEVDFDVQRNLPDCQKISTGSIVSTDADSARYDRFRIPANQFECMRNDCVNSGTYYNGGKKTTYKFKLNATEFAAGVLTFYVLPPAEANAKVKVQLADKASMDNADVYEIALSDIKKGSDGFSAVVIDLTQTPTSTSGSGWSKDGENIYVSIEVTDATDNELVGISTLAMFEDMDDFAVSTHVIARCLTSIDGNYELDLAEQTCFRTGKFDTSELQEIEKTVNYRTITPNFWRLNPMYNKGGMTEAWDKEVIETTVKELSGTDYGYISIDDMKQDECGFVSVQVLYDCREAGSAADAVLERLSIPTRVDMDEAHYQLMDDGNGNTIILFNSVHIGREMLVSYPKIVNVTDSFEITDEFVNELRTRMTYKKCLSDGTKWRFIFNNVLVKSISDSLTEDEEIEGEIGLSIQRDKNGKFGYVYRIVE